jgi:hypothetical protein
MLSIANGLRIVEQRLHEAGKISVRNLSMVSAMPFSKNLKGIQAARQKSI